LRFSSKFEHGTSVRGIAASGFFSARTKQGDF
jgi:hypothetical protein